MCSCPTRPRSCTPTSTRSSPRSSSATTRACAGRPVIVGGGVVLAASYEAKACGVRTAMGGAQARRLCPQAIVVPPRMSAYSEASKAVFAVFEDTTPLVEGLSIDEAFLDVRGLERIVGHAGRDRGAAAARGARAGRAADHGRRRADEVPRQGGERRGEARRPARRAARRRARVPASAAGRAAVGRRAGDRARSCTRAGSRPSARSRSSPRRRSSRCSAGRRAGTCTRSPTTATRGACGSAAGGARSGRSARSAGGEDRRRRSTPSSSRSSTGSPAGCARRAASAARSSLRLRFDDFSRATRSHTLPEATAQTQTILATARELLAAAMPLIERQGLTLVGHLARQPRRRRRGPARAAVRPASARARSTRRSTSVRDRFGSDAITRAVLLGRDPGIVDAAAARLRSGGRPSRARTPSGRRRSRPGRGWRRGPAQLAVGADDVQLGRPAQPVQRRQYAGADALGLGVAAGAAQAAPAEPAVERPDGAAVVGVRPECGMRRGERAQAERRQHVRLHEPRGSRGPASSSSAPAHSSQPSCEPAPGTGVPSASITP